MNIVDFLQQLIDRYNEENQCGFCWNFIHARHDYANIAKIPEEKLCCAQFMLEKHRIDDGIKEHFDLGMTEVTHYDSYFRAFVGFNSKFDIQFHNELEPESESKYELYIRPLEECFREGFKASLCELMTDTDITQQLKWSVESKINEKDNNFDGVYVTGTLRTYLQ